MISWAQMHAMQKNPLIWEALLRELRLYEARERLASEEIADLERRYGMRSDEFMSRFEAGQLGDDRQYFEWWGLIRGLQSIREQMARCRWICSGVYGVHKWERPAQIQVPPHG